jgi:hypothetical protein
MPKDPKRNIQSYQLRGGHLNEFEYQKSQGELAEDSELPFSEEAGNPDPTDTLARIDEVTAEAHRKVEKRKKRGLVPVGSRKSNAASKRSAKKVARKSAKKKTTRASTKKRASAGGKKSAQKTASKTAKKGAPAATRKKRSIKGAQR